MKPYLAHIKVNLRLTLRDKMILFFNYAFPLVFFFIFAQAFDAKQGGAINQVVTMVLIIGVLGTGFFGAGIRAVQDREANILRRFKVAPITPSPILAASLVVGLLAYLPAVVLFLLLAHFAYGMAMPANILSLFAFISVAVVAFRSMGLVIASVVNSMQESQIVIQLIYLPMLFLSGATFPLTMLPDWVQIVAQFMPATYLYTGLQGIMLRHESLAENWSAACALLLTTAIGTFIGVKLFRWEKTEKLPASAKLWLVAVFAPFIAMGAWQARTHGTMTKAKLLDRQMARSRTTLIRDARIFTGDGKVIPAGAVLIRAGKIAEIFEGPVPKKAEGGAIVVEGSGKTIIPGLIDTHVHLGGPGGLMQSYENYDFTKAAQRELAAYLYSGVTAARSAGDGPDLSLRLKSEITSGARLGAEVFTCGPMFTVEGGHGTEYFEGAPEQVRDELKQQLVRLPKTADEARAQVRELKSKGVDCVKAILDAGSSSFLFNRMDISLLRAIVEAAHARNLPVVVHTGDSSDVADAIAANADGIEHGSARDAIPDGLLAKMAQKHITLDPTLSVVEAWNDFVAGKTDLLDRSLTQQVGPAELLQSTKKMIDSAEVKKLRERLGKYPADLGTAMDNLRRAYRAGVPLVAGSDSGNYLVIHGPAIHRELQLWVKAEVPAKAALKAATSGAARSLRAADELGRIAKGRDATLLLLDGNPLEDISATERISAVFFKGERINRSSLFKDQ